MRHTLPQRLSQAVLVNALVVFALISSPAAGDEPSTNFIALHPDNPHYFLWRGKPTILVTSGEHYGALLNLDFDYMP